MSVHGNIGIKDGAGNVSVGASGSKDPHTVSGTVIASGIKGPGVGVVGTTVGYEHSGGHSASLTGQHIRGFGNEVHAAGAATLVNTNDHVLKANAFTTRTMPSNSPAFSTHGGGIDYSFQDKVSAGAAVTSTPRFNETQYSVNSSVNLHQTPNSALTLKAVASKSTGPYRKGNWDNGVFLNFRRDF